MLHKLACDKAIDDLRLSLDLAKARGAYLAQLLRKVATDAPVGVPKAPTGAPKAPSLIIAWFKKYFEFGDGLEVTGTAIARLFNNTMGGVAPQRGVFTVALRELGVYPLAVQQNHCKVCLKRAKRGCCAHSNSKARGKGLAYLDVAIKEEYWHLVLHVQAE